MSDSENNNFPSGFEGVSEATVSSSEFTGPGSAYQVFKQYNKRLANEYGKTPVFIKPDESEKKNKIRLT